jgi:hypothetical protein
MTTLTLLEVFLGFLTAAVVLWAAGLSGPSQGQV